jgi:glycosyltransferase involved in cell wall biosynthesis
MMPASVSVVIPAKNEAGSIGAVVAGVLRACPGAEVLVVDDGSTDATGDVARTAGATVVRHAGSRGNGAAIKTGARAARGEILVFMDADGQHDPGEISKLLAGMDRFDMVVGTRGRDAQASVWRLLGNRVYNRLASLIVGHPILDLTSGFRAVRARLFREFMHLYPNGFSYPTTSTMAFFRAGYGVGYVPVDVARRAADSDSHISILRDGGRFLLIIFRVGTLYSPLKIFFPVSLAFFTGGLLYCSYTLTTMGRFTNFGALLLVTSVLVFLIGLVSEQITMLLFKDSASRPPAGGDRP